MKARPAHRWIPALFAAFALAPIYWLIVLSFQTNAETGAGLSLWPDDPTLSNYLLIFTGRDWYMGYLNALAYVSINVALSIGVALPAAYAFSRYSFLGDRQTFFLFLACRMTAPAILLVPYVQVFSSFGLIDTYIAVALAHCLFNVPIAIWILEGFISSIPREMDEMAKIDGYSGYRFGMHILLPQIAPGIGATAFFCFLFSWVEILLAHALTTVHSKPIGVVMSKVASPLGGIHIGAVAAASVLTLIPGMLVAYFVRNYIARGFSMGQVK